MCPLTEKPLPLGLRSAGRTNNAFPLEGAPRSIRLEAKGLLYGHNGDLEIQAIAMHAWLMRPPTSPRSACLAISSCSIRPGDSRRGQHRFVVPSKSSALPSKPSFIVLGLGNPGEEYAATRHNFGWLVLDEIAREERLTFARGDGPFRACAWNVGGSIGVLAKPTTYMNRCGAAAGRLRELFPGVAYERWLVVSDDLDLPLGRIRLRAGGGAGGHNGLRSLIDALQTNEVPRLRLGIGRPLAADREEVVDWVLEPFSKEEQRLLPEILGRATQSVRDVIREGLTAAMNRTNATRSEEPADPTATD